MNDISKKIKGFFYSDSIREIATQIFQSLLLVFLLTLLIHEFKPLYVEHYISLNNFLVVVIVFGVIAVLMEPDKLEIPDEALVLTNKDYILIAISGIIGTVIVWYKLRDVGWVAYLISAMSGVLIVTLSILMVEESSEGTDEFTKE